MCILIYRVDFKGLVFLSPARIFSLLCQNGKSAWSFQWFSVKSRELGSPLAPACADTKFPVACVVFSPHRGWLWLPQCRVQEFSSTLFLWPKKRAAAGSVCHWGLHRKRGFLSSVTFLLIFTCFGFFFFFFLIYFGRWKLKRKGQKSC